MAYYLPYVPSWLIYFALGLLMLLSLGVVGLSAVGLYYIENTQDNVKNLGIKPEVANVAKSSSVICIIVGVIGFIVACYTIHRVRSDKLNNRLNFNNQRSFNNRQSYKIQPQSQPQLEVYNA